MAKIVSKKHAAKTKSKSVYVERHRRRQKRAGLRRMEVAVKPKDAGLLKSIVSTLCEDGPEADRLRQSVQADVPFTKVKTGADLYATLRKLAPLADEVDLTSRNDGVSRPIVEFE